jgi:hypothetical protein
MREPVTSYSRAYQPGPTPKTYRLFERWQRVEISLASNTGWRTGRTRMPVAMSTRDVRAAA